MIEHSKKTAIASDGDETHVQGPDWDGDPHLITDAAAVRTALGLAAIATSGSASDLGSGAVPAARMPALTGDVTTSVGAVATVIVNDAYNAVTNAIVITGGQALLAVTRRI